MREQRWRTMSVVLAAIALAGVVLVAARGCAREPAPSLEAATRGDAPPPDSRAAPRRARLRHAPPAEPAPAPSSMEEPVRTASPPPQDGAGPATRVTGRVLESDGTPAVGVAVVLVRDPGRGPLDWADATNARGYYSLEGAPPGRYVLEARPAGRAPVDVEVHLSAGAAVMEDLRLLPSGSVEFLVSDDAGAPVAGARLILRAPGFDALSGVSDERGRWVALVERSSTLTVRVADELGLVPPVPAVVGPDAGRVDVVLRDAGSASGVVLAPDGERLRGAYLDVLADGAKRETVMTDAAGAFEVAVPRGASVDLLLDGKTFHGGKVRRVPYVGRLDGVRAGDRGLVLRTVVEALDRELEVVVLAPTGEPVEHARVWASGPLGKTYATTHSGADGRCRLAGLPGRDTRLWADASEAASAGPVLLWGPVELIPDGGTVEVHLEPAAVISGTVVVPAADDVGVNVSAYRGLRRIAWTRTERGGTFELRVPADLTGTLTVRAQHRRNGTRVEAEVRGVEPGASGVRIELPLE